MPGLATIAHTTTVSTTRSRLEIGTNRPRILLMSPWSNSAVTSAGCTVGSAAAPV